MLHAALQGKISVNDLSEDGSVARINEDSLTSIVFGLMTYLPGEIAWSLLQMSSSARSGIAGLPPFRFGKLERAEFWPAWAPKGHNVRFTEPDVYLRFVMGDPDVVVDIIVEAKRNGSASQSGNQWRQQIEAYADTVLAEESEPPDKLYYFAVSGLDKGYRAQIEALETPPGLSPKPQVVVADWTDFSNAARYLRDMGQPQTQRLMTMMLQGLAKGGFVQRLYFDSLRQPRNLEFRLGAPETLIGGKR